jgi:predicted permease
LRGKAELPLTCNPAVSSDYSDAGFSGGQTLTTFYQDLRYALRQLRKSPVFTLTAVLTLALGIGANTAVFTLVHEVMLKSLPVADPGGLYRVGDKAECCVWDGFQEDYTIFSYPLYQYLQEHTPEFTEMAASQTSRPGLSVRREGAALAENLAGELVSGNYFSTLGVRSAAGRLIAPADDQAGAPVVAVMSYRAWQQKYGMDSSMLGRGLTVNGIPVTLIGIAAPGFYGDRRDSFPPDLWLPIALEPTLHHDGPMLHFPDPGWLYLIGRLRPGTKLEQVSAHMTAELQQFLSMPGNIGPEANRDDIKKQAIRVSSGAGGVNFLQDQYKQGLYLLLAAASVILLIACANVANLVLARSRVTRVRTSLQMAIGATRGRIIRSQLTETVLLSVLGGIAGLALAYLASRAMVMLAFRGAQVVPVSASPSWPVLGFTFLVSLQTGIVFGVGPAWLASRSDPAEALHGATRSTQDGSALPQKSLVVLQAALSLVLLTVAGLLTQSLRNLQNQPYGFEREGRILVEFNPNSAGYTQERLLGLYQQLEERFKHTPGVINESLSLYTAQQNRNWSEGIHILGRSERERNGPSWDRVSAHYFETIGTPVLRGRGFTEGDSATTQRVAVVNEAFVKTFFPNADPIGQHFGKGDAGHAGDYEIVGVVKAAKYQDPAQPPNPMFFLPLAQTINNYADPGDQRIETGSKYMGTIELHVAGDPGSFYPIIRRLLAGVDPNLTANRISTFDEQILNNTTEKTMMSRLCGVFGLIALLLASIGLYGLTAYQVARRTSEIGVRMALGADRLNILRLVLRGAFLQVGIGLIVGIPLVFLCGKLLGSQLYGVGGFNPLILSVAVTVLATCALVASIMPARRAAGIDPMRALRTE